MGPFKAFIKNPKKMLYEGEDANEQILYVLRSSLITTLPWVALTSLLIVLPVYLIPFMASFKNKGESILGSGFLSVFTMFWYTFTFGFFFQSLLNWYYNVYIITNKKIMDFDFHGVIFKNIAETTLDNIEDVTSTVRGAFGIIFNIGEVKIQTAAEKPEFEFSHIDNPAAVRDIISDLVVWYKNEHNHPDNN